MTSSVDAYYDELGIAWCAIGLETNMLMPGLKAHMRRQAFLITASLFIGLPLIVAAFFLGALTIWTGWTTGAWNFVTRGIAVLIVATLLSIAMSLLLPVRGSDNVRAVSEMIDLSIARAAKLLMIIRLGLYACAVAAVLGLAGTAIRTYLARPPAMSPLIDLAMLAVVALGLVLYGRHVRGKLSKFEYLKRALAVVD